MSQPYKCPVCHGRGVVPQGFYRSQTGSYTVSSPSLEENCNSCGGTGILWSK